MADNITITFTLTRQLASKISGLIAFEAQNTKNLAVDREEYRRVVDQLMTFLVGTTDQLKGTGRTTREIIGAPKNAIYIVEGPTTEAVAAAQAIGVRNNRLDLLYASPRLIDMHASLNPDRAIVIDHAFMLDDVTKDYVNAHNSRVQARAAAKKEKELADDKVRAEERERVARGAAVEAGADGAGESGKGEGGQDTSQEGPQAAS